MATEEQIEAGLLPSADPLEREGFAEEFPITDIETDITKTPAVFSSQQGADIVDQKVEVEKRIAPSPEEKPPEQIQAEAEEARRLEEERKRETIPLTLINPETGQESTFGDPEINIRNIQRFIDRGFEVVEGELPARVILRDEAPEVTKANQELENAKNEVAALTEKLTSFDVSQDPALKQQISNITSQYDTRIRQMERVNESRKASLSQTGIRLGGRFTENIFGGIITEEERQGITRVGELENLKQNAIINARTAFRTQKWNEYVDQINIAERALERQTAEISALNEMTLKKNQEIEDKFVQASRDSAIAGLLSIGITSPTQILSFLNFDEQGNQIGDFTAEEISNTLKNITDESTIKNLTGEAKDFQSFVNLGMIDSSLPIGEQWQSYLDITKEDKLLSTTEAEKLGVPFGTTESEAFGRYVVSTKEDKQPSSTQFQAATFAKRMELAEGVLSGGRGIFVPWLPKFVRSEDRRLFEQSERNFINALLRRESGAAIAPDEFVSAREQYIPIASDPQSVLEAKARNRNIVFEGLKAEGFDAFDIISEQVGGFNAFTNPERVNEVDKTISNLGKAALAVVNPLSLFSVSPEKDMGEEQALLDAGYSPEQIEEIKKAQ